MICPRCGTCHLAMLCDICRQKPENVVFFKSPVFFLCVFFTSSRFLSTRRHRAHPSCVLVLHPREIRVQALSSAVPKGDNTPTFLVIFLSFVFRFSLVQRYMGCWRAHVSACHILWAMDVPGSPKVLLVPSVFFIGRIQYDGIALHCLLSLLHDYNNVVSLS